MNTQYVLSFYTNNVSDKCITTLVQNIIKAVPDDIELYKINDLWCHVSVSLNATHKKEAITFVNSPSTFLTLNDLLFTYMLTNKGASDSAHASKSLSQKDKSKKSLKYKNKFFSSSKKVISKKQQTVLKSLLGI